MGEEERGEARALPGVGAGLPPPGVVPVARLLLLPVDPLVEAVLGDEGALPGKLLPYLGEGPLQEVVEVGGVAAEEGAGEEEGLPRPVHEPRGHEPLRGAPSLVFVGLVQDEEAEEALGEEALQGVVEALPPGRGLLVEGGAAGLAPPPLLGELLLREGEARPARGADGRASLLRPPEPVGGPPPGAELGPLPGEDGEEGAFLPEEGPHVPRPLQDHRPRPLHLRLPGPLGHQVGRAQDQEPPLGVELQGGPDRHVGLPRAHLRGEEGRPLPPLQGLHEARDRQGLGPEGPPPSLPREGAGLGDHGGEAARRLLEEGLPVPL